MRKIIEFFILILLYTIIFFLFSYPLSLYFLNGFISENNGDAPQFIWNAYIFLENISNFKNPFYTNKIFYPYGTTLFMHDYSIIYGILNLLFKNPIASVNVGIYLSFIFSAIGAYYLCKNFINDVQLSFLTGFIFSFCPFKTSHLFGHFGLIFTVSIPFFICYFFRSFTWKGDLLFKISKKYLFICSLFFILSLISHYYLSSFLLVFIVLYFIYKRKILKPLSKIISKKIFWQLILIFFLFNISAIFLYFSNIFPSEFKRSLKEYIKYASSLSADLSSFLIPHYHSKFYNFQLVKNIHFSLLTGTPVEQNLFIGYTILILFFLYLNKRQELEEKFPETKFIFFLTIWFFILSIPFVRILGKLILISPISILNFIPFLNNVRCPCRFSLMIMLFLPILIGFYIKEYISKKLSRIQYFLFNLALFFILFIEYLPSPYQVKKFEETPGVYFYLQNCKEGTLLEIPFGIEDAFTSLGKNLRDQMFYQTIHKKNILGGYISRLNTKIFNLFQKDEFISTLFNICNNSMPNKNFSKEKVENFIKNYKIKYIVVYPECKTKKTQIFIVRTFENFISKKINYENYLLIYLKSLE